MVPTQISPLSRWLLSVSTSFFLVSSSLHASDPKPKASVDHNPKTAESQSSRAPDGDPSITQPLSPTALNVFNFGPHKFKVQYPPGVSFSGIEMTVDAVSITQSEFSERVANSSFAKSLCVVYTEEGACIDYQVTCSNSASQPVACPGAPSPYISVDTSFDTEQSIINPGLLTTPIGLNEWENVMMAYYQTRIDPTAHGRTKGFSEFVAVSRGALNSQGLGKLTFNAPLRSTDPRSFPAGSVIPVSFHLTSVAHPGEPVTDSNASLSVLMVANGSEKPVSKAIFHQTYAFVYQNGSYQYPLEAQKYAAGTYILTVYGDAFAAQEVSFQIQ
jgi:hypothetical protein